jgi:hypothetical protein
MWASVRLEYPIIDLLQQMLSDLLNANCDFSSERGQFEFDGSKDCSGSAGGSGVMFSDAASEIRG